jgi:hypothetical protein
LGSFDRWRLHGRTPAPPPFSSMNSMQASIKFRGVAEGVPLEIEFNNNKRAGY